MRHSCKYSSRFAASWAASTLSVLEILQPDEQQHIYRIYKLREWYLSNQNIQTKLLTGVFQVTGMIFFFLEMNKFKISYKTEEMKAGILIQP